MKMKMKRVYKSLHDDTTAEQLYKNSKLSTVVEGDLKAPFSIAKV